MGFYDVYKDTHKPYLSKRHRRMRLLVRHTKERHELFICPYELGEVQEMLEEAQALHKELQLPTCVTPQVDDSYASYFARLDALVEAWSEVDPQLAGAPAWLAGAMRRINLKRSWSVMRYLGNDLHTASIQLTHGRCYYWPTCYDFAIYQGVIDDTERGLVEVPLRASDWRIVEDPAGMAEQVLSTWEGTSIVLSAENLEGVEQEGFDGLNEHRGPTLRAHAAVAPAAAEPLPFYGAFNPTFDAGWGITRYQEACATCQNCGARIDQKALVVLNARQNPELAQQLLEGKLGKVICPACGNQYQLMYPRVYVDPAHGACMNLTASPEDVQESTELLELLNGERSALARSRKRLVWSVQNLREKAQAFADDLDDRVIELLKVRLARQARGMGVLPMGEVFAVRFERRELSGRLSFAFLAAHTMLELSLHREEYNALEFYLLRSDIAGEEPLYVDELWAEAALDYLQSRGLYPL